MTETRYSFDVVAMDPSDRVQCLTEFRRALTHLVNCVPGTISDHCLRVTMIEVLHTRKPPAEFPDSDKLGIDK